VDGREEVAAVQVREDAAEGPRIEPSGSRAGPGLVSLSPPEMALEIGERKGSFYSLILGEVLIELRVVP
jgi:hypothetical protein